MKNVYFLLNIEKKAGLRLWIPILYKPQRLDLLIIGDQNMPYIKVGFDHGVPRHWPTQFMLWCLEENAFLF